QNSTEIIGRIMLSISTIALGDENFNNTRDASMAKLGALAGMQEVDYASALRSTLPVADHGDLSSSDGPVLISFVVTTESDSHDGAALSEIQSKVNTWTDSIEIKISQTGDKTSSVFSYSQLLLGQNENLGRELGILNSVSLLILGSILWLSFRSKRDTGYVLGLTVLGIGATYGTSGALTVIGVPMTFNAAMNSIPVLLLAIGVDYGLHVVKRVREEYQAISSSLDRSVESVGALNQKSRRAAILRGTKFTSIALLIAIFTDMVGFLSFRLSSQDFLVVFGTVIAIGLFYIYVLSITALPALIALFPPKDMPIKKAVKIHESWLSKKIGGLTRLPVGVVSVAILVSLPAVMGIQRLEVGFDTRDNFDESVPVVSDFILISEQFQSSPSPLYVVLDGDVISPEGREMVEKVIQKLREDDRVALVTSDIWSILDSERAYEPELDMRMNLIDSDNSGGWEELSNWLLNTEKGRSLSSGLFSSSGDQTLISFQASTLDWTATTVFQADMTESIDQATYGSSFEASLSGRSLILAQITADVAEAAVVSTSVVAGVILLMLLVIQTGRTGDPVRGIKRGFVAWLPLMAVVAWVFGIMGYTGFQLNSQTVTIGALTLGLGVDYAIHIATRLEEEAEHDPQAGPEVWVSRAVSTTGRAMGAAAITTAGGFSVLNLSSLVPLQLFGQAFVVAIALALISSLFVLTPLYAKLLEGEIA
ncbi:MAG: MMPL family transporter, partial [Candidatus Thalassarchaeaceae archaeon]|nr:MMPL family transporter [Candidatus Thalassarchaeaceae archaeon]